VGCPLPLTGIPLNSHASVPGKTPNMGKIGRLMVELTLKKKKSNWASYYGII
jgi:hypothetical protein